MDIGGGLGLYANDDYPDGKMNKFQGLIRWLRIDLRDNNVSHIKHEDLKYQRITEWQ